MPCRQRAATSNPVAIMQPGEKVRRVSPALWMAATVLAVTASARAQSGWTEPSRRSGMYDEFSYGYLGFTLGPDGHTLYYLTGAGGTFT